jgi:hypothetical protein
LGRLQPWFSLAQGDGDGSARRSVEQEKRAGVLDVGRALAGRAPVNSGDEQCTSDGERGELERERRAWVGEEERRGRRFPFIERGRIEMERWPGSS